MAWSKDWTLAEAKSFFNNLYGYPELDSGDEEPAEIPMESKLPKNPSPDPQVQNVAEIQIDSEVPELLTEIELPKNTSPAPEVQNAAEMQMDTEVPEVLMEIGLPKNTSPDPEVEHAVPELLICTEIELPQNPLYIDVVEYLTDVKHVKLMESINLEPCCKPESHSSQISGFQTRTSSTSLALFTETKTEKLDQCIQNLDSSLKTLNEDSADSKDIPTLQSIWSQPQLEDTSSQQAEIIEKLWHSDKPELEGNLELAETQKESASTTAKETETKIGDSSTDIETQLGTISPGPFRRSLRSCVLAKEPGYYKYLAQLRQPKASIPARQLSGGAQFV